MSKAIAQIQNALPLQIAAEPAHIRPTRRRARFESAGFSLIEALTALTIFAFVLAGLSFLLLNTAETNVQARRMTAATQLAEAQLEVLRSTGAAAATSGTDSNNPLTEAGTAGGIYTRSWTVGAGPVAGTAEATVTIQWSDKSGSHTVRLQTIL